MTSKTHLSLTKHQTAVLNEMGIVSWRLLGEPSKIDDKLKADSAPAAKMVTKSVPEHIKQLKSAGKADSSKPASSAATSLKGKVLITLSESAYSKQMLQDLLLAMNKASLVTEFQPQADIQAFYDYELAIIQGRKLKLTDQVLCLPDSEQLANPSVKRQLWSLIGN